MGLGLIMAGCVTDSGSTNSGGGYSGGGGGGGGTSVSTILSPYNDSYWYPEALMDSLDTQGAPWTESYNGSGDYALSYDTWGYGLSDGNLDLTYADFNESYGGYDSAMTFGFQTYDGWDCTATMARSGALYDVNTDWRFVSYSNGSSADGFDCESVLYPDEAIESISSIL